MIAPEALQPVDVFKEASDKYKADIARVKVWDAFSDLFLDTFWDQEELDRLAERIAESPFSFEELGHILFFEVSPVCAPNLYAWPGGEWAGFSADWLIPKCLKQQQKHRFKSNGKSNKVRIFVHVLGFGPASEAYYLLFRVERIRAKLS